MNQAPIKAPLHLPLAIVDLETTGANPSIDRVIEIGVILIDNGEISQRWQRLIDPQQSLPYFISSLTGITDKDLRDAPLFADVCDELQALLKDRLFVAHNVRFDYGFLKSEFERRGQSFKPDLLCTVRWSRQLYPQLKGHGLDAICARFGIGNEARHRALGDAEATWQFLQLTCNAFSAEQLYSALVKQQQRPSLPPAISAERINTIPNGCGIYRFYGEQGQLLYIGKSKHLRERIMSHFSASPVSARNQRLHQMIRDVEWESTAGELGALLKENAAIKAEQPQFNRRLRHSKHAVAVSLQRDKQGYLRAKISSYNQHDPTDFALFRTRTQAKNTLLELCTQHKLCKKLLGLETAKAGCFDVQLQRCKGACVGTESSEHYNLRVQLALAPLMLNRWPFGHAIAIKEQHQDQTDLHVIDHWRYLGTAHNEHELERIRAVEKPFDMDTYRLLVRALRLASKIIPLAS